MHMYLYHHVVELMKSKDNARICGDYQLEFGSGAVSRRVGSMANIITKHFFTEILNKKISWLPNLALAALSESTETEIIKLVDRTSDPIYIPIMKYICYHMGIENFKLFMELIKSYMLDAKRITTMYIINAEALCFIYKITERAEEYNKMIKVAEKSDIFFLKAKYRDEVNKTLNTFDSITFPFLNKSDAEITTTCKRIFKFEIKN